MFLRFIRDTLEEIRYLRIRKEAGIEATRAFIRERTCANCGAWMEYPPECAKCGAVLGTTAVKP